MKSLSRMLLFTMFAASGSVLAQDPPVLSPNPAPRRRPQVSRSTAQPVQTEQRRSGQIAQPANPAVKQPKWPSGKSAPDLSIDVADSAESSRALFEDARRALIERKPAEALPLLRKLESSVPDRFEVQYLLGIALVLTNNPDAAVGAFRKTISLNAKSAASYSLLCMALAETGKRFDAIDACIEASHLEPANERYQAQLAGLYVSERMAAEAIRLLAGKRTETDDLVDLGTLGDAYYLNAEYAKAAVVYETIVKRWPTVSLTYLRLSGVYDYLDRPSDAVAAAKKFAELESNLALAHLNLGLVLQSTGLFFESIDSLLKAVDFDRVNGWAYLALSESYETVGDRENLLGSLRHAYQYLPDRSFELSYRYGTALTRNGHNREAVEPLERAHALRPHPQTMMSLGLAYIEDGQYDKGIPLVERSKELSPLPPGFTMNFDHHKNRHALLARFDEIVAEADRNPNSVAAHNEAYSVYVYKGMTKEAERHGLEMVRLEPGNWKCYTGMGIFYSRIGETEKALAMAKKAAQLNPNAVLYMTVAYQLTKLGRIDEAIEALKRSISIKPLLEVHLELGDLWVKKGNRKEALAQYLAGQQSGPNDPRPYFRLAWLYLRMGDKEGAVRQYQILKNIAPDDVSDLGRAINALFGPTI